MRLNEITLGIAIAQKYYDNPNGYKLTAEDDQINLYATNQPMSDEDVAKMKKLGWFQPDNDGETYDPENGWAAFV